MRQFFQIIRNQKWAMNLMDVWKRETDYPNKKAEHCSACVVDPEGLEPPTL